MSHNRVNKCVVELLLNIRGLYLGIIYYISIVVI